MKRNLILMTLVLALFGLAACSSPAAMLPAASGVPSAVSYSVPQAAGNAANAADPSNADVAAIQSVIQKANQEQVQALAANDPTLMQDTATTTYYDQSAQTLSNMQNGGVTAIELVNLSWGPITLQDAKTAQATTYETWTTNFDDGSVLKETDMNVYTLVLQDGAWKVQDDQHPTPQQSTANNPGAAPTPVAPLAPVGGAQSQSRNWAGYTATGGTFTAVSGTWTVPDVNSATTGIDATWVGIGGVDSTDLIQAGTQATVQGGQVVYSAWWETLPQVAQDVALTVNAGDTITVSIAQQADGTWKIVMSDTTNAQTWTKTLSYQSSRSSAEWVEEAPSGGGRRMQQLPLDDFGMVTFTGASAVENGKTESIAQANGQPITMGGGSQVLAQSTLLAGNGDSFSVVRTDTADPSTLPGRRGITGTQTY